MGERTSADKLDAVRHALCVYCGQRVKASTSAPSSITFWERGVMHVAHLRCHLEANGHE